LHHQDRPCQRLLDRWTTTHGAWPSCDGPTLQGEGGSARPAAGFDYHAAVPDLVGLAVLMATALVASVIAGVVGFGAGIIMRPAIAWVVGVKAAAPVLTVTMLLGNLSRLWWSRHELDGRAAFRYLLGAIPTTVLGVVIYAHTPREWLGRS